MRFHPSILRRNITTIFSRALLTAAITLLASAAWAKDCFVYFGTFTDTTSRGIYVSRLNMDTGKLSEPQLAVASVNPNYLAISPDSRFLYAATRGDGTNFGVVSAFTIDGQTGALSLLDQKSSGANGVCFVGLDTVDHALLAANYNGASVKSFRVNPDGTLADGTYVQHSGSSVNRVRQASAHAHCFVAAPAGRFALACDLGMDKVMIYKVNPRDATLTPNDPPFAAITPGSGPRHVAFSPDGKTACVLSEMACTVTVFKWDGRRGRLKERQTVSLLPEGEYQKTFTAAEIAYRPDGRFVYATVRTHNSVSVLAVDARGGNLSLIQNVPCGGDFPRGMGIDPSGRWLIVGNQKSGTVTAFGIDADSGKLTPTGQSFNIGSAVDVKFATIP
jgi:6-phosphogluconolactonase